MNRTVILKVDKDTWNKWFSNGNFSFEEYRSAMLDGTYLTNGFHDHFEVLLKEIPRDRLKEILGDCGVTQT